MSDTAPAPVPAPPTAVPPVTTPAPPVPAPAPTPVGRKAFLVITAVLFFGWIGWLSYTALTKSREPIVSRAQAAAASVAVRAKVDAGDPDRESLLVRPGAQNGPFVNVLKGQADKPALVVEVLEKLHTNGPEAGTKIGVTNLPACAGYTGPGEYLLLLNKDSDATLDGRPVYTVVGQQRSPGADLEGVGPPLIYKWSADVGKQALKITR